MGFFMEYSFLNHGKHDQKMLFCFLFFIKCKSMKLCANGPEPISTTKLYYFKRFCCSLCCTAIPNYHKPRRLTKTKNIGMIFDDSCSTQDLSVWEKMFLTFKMIHFDLSVAESYHSRWITSFGFYGNEHQLLREICVFAVRNAFVLIVVRFYRKNHLKNTYLRRLWEKL